MNRIDNIAPSLISKPNMDQNPLLPTSPRQDATPSVGFADHLRQAIQDVDTSNRVADTKLELLASGKDVDIHGTMIALQEADIALRTMTSFRDKLTEGYKSIINMAI